MKSLRIFFTVLVPITAFFGFESRADILESWTTNHISTVAAIDCVVFGKGRYVAYGETSDYGYLYSSDDGFNWTPRTSESVPAQLSYARSLVYCGGKFFALGGFGTYGTSS